MNCDHDALAPLADDEPEPAARPAGSATHLLIYYLDRHGATQVSTSATSLSAKELMRHRISIRATLDQQYQAAKCQIISVQVVVENSQRVYTDLSAKAPPKKLYLVPRSCALGLALVAAAVLFYLPGQAVVALIVDSYSAG
jgi:hypothetical protein